MVIKVPEMGSGLLLMILILQSALDLESFDEGEGGSKSALYSAKCSAVLTVSQPMLL